jgi:hypothetical protein
MQNIALEQLAALVQQLPQDPAAAEILAKHVLGEAVGQATDVVKLFQQGAESADTLKPQGCWSWLKM